MVLQVGIERVQQEIAETRKALLAHPIYKKIKTIDDVKQFTEHHIYAVWDFMSLLKSLQQEFTCVSVPWTPPKNPTLTHLINEIVLAEESDVDRHGVFGSHFDLYYRAMENLGANTKQIQVFLQTLQANADLKTAALIADLPASVFQFLSFTFDVIESKKMHCIAAVFTFGREDLIPDMFTELVRDLRVSFPEELNDFVYYLDRHIELDGDEHGPLALQMIAELCGDDEQKWNEVIEVSKKALEVRSHLWDGIFN